MLRKTACCAYSLSVSDIILHISSDVLDMQSFLNAEGRIDWTSCKYDREATINATRSFYEFLVSMVVPSECPLIPPSEIDKDRFHRLGKSDEVVQLLKHLPYLSE